MKRKQAVSGALLTLAYLAAAGGGAYAAHTTDSQIESSVKKSFVFKHYLQDDEIHVKSRNGVVTLTGSVSAEHHRTLANHTASAQHGVASVNNRLEVRPAAPAEKSDAWLVGKVKAVLLFHRSVSAVKTDVDASEGVVTLRGSADTQAQKDLTGEYARDVEGVKDVDNEILVSSAASLSSKLEDRIDDASITAQVKLALLFHRSTSAVRTHVETRAGVVTLTGSAESAAERDLVEKIVSDVKGVKSVSNRIRAHSA